MERHRMAARSDTTPSLALNIDRDNGKADAKRDR
jgi:hypothetical protein